MKIKILSENTTEYKLLGTEHGLSIYLEANGRRVLFDMGASSLFHENAVEMGVDLSQVDLAVLSHGHYDHGGGLGTFLAINDHAPVYLSRRAFGERFAKTQDGGIRYVGIDGNLSSNPRLHFVEGNFALDENMTLLSEIPGRRHMPSGNRNLVSREGEGLVPDPFDHELSLIVREEGAGLLIAGCAHKGIVNIVEAYSQVEGQMPDFVFSGFHLTSKAAGGVESPEVIQWIGEELHRFGGEYFTGHCTGEKAFQILKEILGDHLTPFRTGAQFILE